MSEYYGHPTAKKNYRTDRCIADSRTVAVLEAEHTAVRQRRQKEANLEKPCPFYKLEVGSEECHLQQGRKHSLCGVCDVRR